MPLKHTLPIAVALIGLLGAQATYAEQPVPFSAGYGRVPVSSPGVVAAARFAASAKSVEVKTILVARQAEVAHLYFRICMRVTDGNRAYLVETEVSRASDTPYSLDSWKQVKTCQ